MLLGINQRRKILKRLFFTQRPLSSEVELKNERPAADGLMNKEIEKFIALYLNSQDNFR